MKRGKIFSLLIIGVFGLIFIGNKDVYADSYDLYLKSDAESTIKSGQIITFEAGIGCASTPINAEELRVIFDKDAFEMVPYENNDPCSEFKLRTGWASSTCSNSNVTGEAKINIKATNKDASITEALASKNCSDDTKANLITFKLKVKDVANKEARVQVLDQTVNK